MTTIQALYLLGAIVGICAFLWAANATVLLHMERVAIDWQEGKW